LLIEISYGPNLEIAYVVGRGWLPLPKKNPTPSPLSALWAQYSALRGPQYSLLYQPQRLRFMVLANPISLMIKYTQMGRGQGPGRNFLNFKPPSISLERVMLETLNLVYR